MQASTSLAQNSKYPDAFSNKSTASLLHSAGKTPEN